MDNVPPPAGDDQDAAGGDQSAAASWPRTLRYCVIITAERLTVVLAVWAAARGGHH